MINIPVWLFVIICILAFIGLIFIAFVLIDVISENIYQVHEKSKFNNRKK